MEGRCWIVGHGDFLALAEDVVGVTLGMLCMAAIVLQWCLGWRGHATDSQGVTTLPTLPLRLCFEFRVFAMLVVIS